MAQANPLLQSLNSGEFSPRMEARVDFDRYPNAAKRLRNVILYPQGGFTRRSGTRFVCEVADSSKATILIPFQYSQEQSYQAEVGDGYMRFLRRQARIEVDATNAAIANGTFTAGITSWDDVSESGSYPTVEKTNVGSSTGASATFVVPLPSNIQAGEMLFIIVALHQTAGRTLTTPAGWTQLFNITGPSDLRRFAGYYKTADGLEGASVTVTASGTADWASSSYRISGFQGTPEAATATGTTFQPDPPSLTPSWGSAKTLWLAFCAVRDNDLAATSPAGFTNLIGSVDSTATILMGSARLNEETATKDPGVFAGWAEFFDVNDWATATVAFRPAASSIRHDLANGRLELPPAVFGDIAAEQDVAVNNASKASEHVLQFGVAGYGLGTIFFRVGSTSGGDDILSEIELGRGENSIGFTPNVNTFYIQFINRSGQTMWIDNVALLSGVPMTIVSPYASADLALLNFHQRPNAVYLLHPSYPPRQLLRFGHRSWSIADCQFEDGPYGSTNDGFDVNTVQVISNPLFENGILGWTDNSTGDGYVNHNDETSIAELDPGSGGGSGVSILRTSAAVANATYHVLHFLIVGASPVTVKVGTSVSDGSYINADFAAGWHSVGITTASSQFHVEFTYDEHDQDRAGIGGVLLYPTKARLLQPDGQSGIVQVTAYGFKPFKSTDVGKLIRLTWPGQEAGWGVIITYSSSTMVEVLVVRSFGSTAPTEDWNLGAWSDTLGYPSAFGSFDGRGIFCNTSDDQARLWPSQSGNPFDMRPDTFRDGDTVIEDDDAISRALDGDQIDPIQWLNGKQQLVVGTAGGQWIISSSGAVITPADMSAKQNTATAGGDVKAVAVEEITIYADRSRRQLYEIGFKFDDNSFVSNDLTILADHILRSPVIQLAYQRRPFSTVWAVRADGKLAALSYNRQHEVLGWTLSTIGGSFGSGKAVVESISVIPGAEDSDQFFNSDERDELWMIVKRTINGVTKRYVEFMEYSFDGPLREDYTDDADPKVNEATWRAAVLAAQVDAFYVDAGLTYSGAPATIITGLDHLEGETVKLLADGRYVGEKTVTGGQVVLTVAASDVQAGLGYKHEYESLKIAVGATAGTAVNKVKAITAIGMVLLDASECKVTTVEYGEQEGRRQFEFQTVGFRKDTANPLDAVALYSGETSVNTETALSTDARMYAESDVPLPFSLLGLAPIVQTQEVPRARG